MPLASLRFEDGQCATLHALAREEVDLDVAPGAPRARRSGAGPTRPSRRRRSSGRTPCCAQALRRSRRASRARACGSARRAPRRAPRCASASRRPRCRARAARGRRTSSASPPIRVARGEALARGSRRRRARRRSGTRSRSCRAPARMPARSAARAVASGKKYMSFTQVTPPRSISAIASRLPSCTNSSLTCLRLRGPDVLLQPRHQRQVVGQAAHAASSPRGSAGSPGPGSARGASRRTTCAAPRSAPAASRRGQHRDDAPGVDRHRVVVQHRARAARPAPRARR